MSAKEFYNKKALKHQLQRAIKYDHKYFKDCIIEIMEQYAEQQINLSLGNVIDSLPVTTEIWNKSQMMSFDDFFKWLEKLRQ